MQAMPVMYTYYMQPYAQTWAYENGTADDDGRAGEKSTRIQIWGLVEMVDGGFGLVLGCEIL